MTNQHNYFLKKNEENIQKWKWKKAPINGDQYDNNEGNDITNDDFLIGRENKDFE